jgi:hypothetical protein
VKRGEVMIYDERMLLRCGYCISDDDDVCEEKEFRGGALCGSDHKRKIAHRASVWDVRVVLAVVFDFHFVHMTCFERRGEKSEQ